MPENLQLAGAAINPWELRAPAQRIAATLCIAVGYAWLGGAFFAHQAFDAALLPPLFLAVGSVISLVLARRWVKPAIYSLVAVLTGTGLAGVMLFGMHWAPLFAIPAVLLAGVLVETRIMVGCSLLLGAGVVLSAAQQGLFGLAAWGELVYPLGLLAVTVFAAWLAGRNLYMALYWALDALESARAERDRRRDQQGKLRQALRSMDEASSRLQRMNYELSRARDAAEELRQFKQQFVTNVSHELRTPLALISGFSEMMYLSPDTYGEPLPRVYQGDVREIYRNSQHLLSLIEDVLDLSRITAGKMLIARQHIDPLPVIVEAANEIRPLIEGKGLRLELELPDALPEAYLDPTRIRQVLINLLNNARRFTDSGFVQLHAEADGQRLLVRVSDSGIGIPPNEQAKLFEEFRQLDGSLTRQHDGTGLGLKISKEFVELHGGAIWVESEGIAGKGSAFVFQVPLGEEGGAQAGAMVRTPRRSPAAPTRHLLAVSRDDSVVPLLRRHLDGYEVVGVADWQAVPELADRYWAEAVILNPTRGQELEEMESLRQLLGDRDIPIVLCPLAGAGQLASYLGVEAYLVKPIDRERLFRTLAELFAADARGEENSSPRTLLIIDDDPRIVRLLTRMLGSSQRNYRIERAYTAREALDLLYRVKVDAILLDIILSDVNGYELINLLRRDSRLSRIPIVILTSLGYDLVDRTYLGSPLVATSFRGGLSNPEALDLTAALLAAQTRLPARPGQARNPPGDEELI